MSLSCVADIFKIKNTYFLKEMPYEEIMAKFKSYDLIVLPDLFVGIEIEVERAVQFNDKWGIWNFRGDGSLRNSGIEWVSYPLPGKAVPAALALFFKGLNSDHQFSPRTSIHMHFDVRHLTLAQISGIVLTYLAVESLLYKFVGNDRDKNIFCVPLYETGLVDDLVNFLNKKLKESNLGNSRYAGLNLDAVRKFGTLEFRQLGGTNDEYKIVKWMNLLMKIYHYGSTHKLGEIIHHISELNTNSYYMSFVNEIFGHLSSCFDLSEIKSDLEKGVKAVKQSTLNNTLLNSLKDNFSATSQMFNWTKKNCNQILRKEERKKKIDEFIFDRNDIRPITIQTTQISSSVPQGIQSTIDWTPAPWSVPPNDDGHF